MWESCTLPLYPALKSRVPAHVRHAPVFHFAIHLHVASDGFYVHGAMAQVQRCGAFHVFSAEIAVVCAEVHVAFAL